jgi:flagellar basal-body rod protein FlgB
MDPSRIPLFDLADQRLAWTDRRQELLAQNIANLNTPRWQSKDLRPFAQTLARANQASVAAPALARTEPGHLAGTQATEPQSLLTAPRGGHQADGNAVSLDDQLTKVADTATAQEIATTLYKKYMSMFSQALGDGQ